MEAAAKTPIDARWVFNFEDWSPTEGEWQKCLSLIPVEERERIGRFKRPTKQGIIEGRHNANAKSSMIGRLMLRKCAKENLGVEPSQQAWRRTAEGKPFLLNTPTSHATFKGMGEQRARAGYNMNVSHDGKMVAFTAGKDFVLGVDVMCNSPSNPMPWAEFHPLFEENFTSREWAVIHAAKDDSLLFQRFMTHWALKESYIKSIGIGLGFELQRAEFTLDDPFNPTSATVKIDGKEKEDWFFEVHSVAHNHTVAVSYGPIEDSIGSVKASLGYPGETKPSSPWATPLRIPFLELTIEDLLC